MGDRSRFQRLGLAVMLLAMTTAVFWGAWGHGFLGYDDGDYVTRNAQVRTGLTPEGARWAFTALYAANWHPLTWLSHMLDAQIFGLSPGGHHLVSILGHGAAAVILFLTAWAYTAALWRSFLLAALFAVHPLHVESVAWVSERKDVLGALLWFLTLAAYLGYLRRPGPGRYLAVVICFGLGLMSKPMLVTLPFVLLLLDYWPLGRWRRPVGGGGRRPPPPRAVPGAGGAGATRALPATRLLTEKVPLLIMSALSSLVTLKAQAAGGMVKSLHVYSLSHRQANALGAYVWYMLKTFLPLGLAMPYSQSLVEPPLRRTAAAAAILLAVSCLTLLWARRRPYLAVGWSWYLGTLVPVIGLVQVADQAMADRYSYIPLTGLFIMLLWAGAEAVGRRRCLRFPAAAGAALVLAALMSVSRVQAGYWRDDETLMRHALRVTSGNWLVHHNLGSILGSRGKLKEAEAQLREALRINPRFAWGLYGLAVNLEAQGRNEEAMATLEGAIAVNPAFDDAHHRLGQMLARQGRLEEAVTRFRAALRINPGFAEAHNSLGYALGRLGGWEEAVAHYREAVRFDPHLARAYNNLGNALMRLGRDEEAWAAFARAVGEGREPGRSQAAPSPPR